MNYSRNELVKSEATVNQMRNAIYHLQRFMKKNDLTEIKERFKRMGKNIAHTYVKYWKPVNKFDLSNISDGLATIYKSILNSTVTIEIDSYNKTITVKDNDCALCKYQFEDINVAGCEITTNMIAEFVNLINAQFGVPFALEPSNIKESRALGNKACIHVYKYIEGGK
jgi:predicted hydrocarbon binding protein